MHVCWTDCQVIRKSSYKGAAETKHSLPVDCSSVLGTMLVLGCVLSTATLSTDAVQTCLSVFRSLEEHMCLSTTLDLLPHDAAFKVELRDGLVSTAQMKNVLRELKLPWCRPTCIYSLQPPPEN